MKQNIIFYSIFCLIIAILPCNGASLSDGFVYVKGNNKVSSFFICDHEVTQKEFKDLMGNHRSNSKGENKPVDGVTWYEAIEYCNKLSLQNGLTPFYKIDKENPDPNNKGFGDEFKWTVTCDFTANGYRLPTETEWEYAARGGNKSKGYKYSGSDNLPDVAWCGENADFGTHPVKTKTPNELGIYDMSGNVSEWCWDWYDKNYPEAKKDYLGPTSGEERVYRGGSYYDDDYCTVDCRDKLHPDGMDYSRGFRVVRSISK